jgi:hypothetical protein
LPQAQLRYIVSLSARRAGGHQEDVMAAGSGVRIGNAEREAAAASLREHYAQGRLTLEEFNQRLDAVFAAKTDVELARITRDLPHVGPYSPPPYSAPWPSQPMRAHMPGSAYPVGAGQGYQRRACGRGSFGWASMAIWLLAIFVIITVSWPLSMLPRTLLILLAVLAFVRRIFRRRIRGRR